MTLQAAIDDLEEIEREHRLLHERIELFHRALRREDGRIASQRDSLLAHLDAHMDTEYRIMRDYGYPLTFTHVEEHAEFRQRFVMVIDEAGRTVDPKNVSSLLKKIHHHHAFYFDEVLCHYLVDKYSLQAVTDGLGI
jgi:hemerythrin